MIEKIESQISASRKYFIVALGGSDDEPASGPNPTKKNVKPEIPAAIRHNPPVFSIVQKCFAPEPSKRPTAARLAQMLLRVCRKRILGIGLKDLGRTYVQLSSICRPVFSFLSDVGC